MHARLHERSLEARPTPRVLTSQSSTCLHNSSPPFLMECSLPYAACAESPLGWGTGGLEP